MDEAARSAPWAGVAAAVAVVLLAASGGRALALRRIGRTFAGVRGPRP